jgi:SAM-dependent methyltransferase
VAAAYRHRPPYPVKVFDLLETLIVDSPRAVLDIGAGEGALARPLAARVDRVDAVEISPEMVSAGAARPGGTRPNLTWIAGPAETASLSGPYALVTAGASLHWMNWEQTLPRIGRVMTPGAKLAIVDQSYHKLEWQDELLKVIITHSRSRDFDPDFSLPDELERLGLFEIHGRHEVAPVAFQQATPDYVEQFHSTASLARELMPPEEAHRFDAEIMDVVRGYENHGMLRMDISASLVWGRPLAPRLAGPPLAGPGLAGPGLAGSVAPHQGGGQFGVARGEIGPVRRGGRQVGLCPGLAAAPL